jgi:hypothetical protein
MLQIVVSLMTVIYDCNMFIIQATGVSYKTCFLRHKRGNQDNYCLPSPDWASLLDSTLALRTNFRLRREWLTDTLAYHVTELITAVKKVLDAFVVAIQRFVNLYEAKKIDKSVNKGRSNKREY